MNLKEQAEFAALKAQVAALAEDNAAMRAELATMRKPLEQQVQAAMERDYGPALKKAIGALFRG